MVWSEFIGIEKLIYFWCYGSYSMLQGGKLGSGVGWIVCRLKKIVVGREEGGAGEINGDLMGIEMDIGGGGGGGGVVVVEENVSSGVECLCDFAKFLKS